MAKKKSEPEHYVNNEEFLQAIIEHREKIEKVERFNLFEDTSDYKPYGFPISLNVIAEK
mgnify:CR=1 FL=1